MDFRLDQSRLLTILEKSEDKKFFYASLLFCKLAEKIWVEDIFDYTVLHGYTHIKSVLRNQEDVLIKFSDDEIFDFLGGKYIFILLAATYSHDFGMKAYYSETHSEYSDLSFDELPFKEKLKIRHIHHEIIDTALSNIVDERELNIFFGKDIIKYLDMILIDKPELSQGVKDLIISNSRKIGIVAKYHNQSLLDFDDLVVRLRNQRKLHMTDDEVQILKLVTALLQFSDALDMSISRVDIEKFYHSVKNIQTLDYNEFQMIHKASRSYLIDSIKSEYIDKAKQNYKIEFQMSLSEIDLEEHYEFIQSIKDEYDRRIKRNDRDCLKIIEDNFNFTSNIVCSEQSVEKNDNKIKLPEVFFEVRENQKKTMGEYLKGIFNELSSKSSLTFFKFYSTSVNVFYGGYCYFPQKTFDQLDEKDTNVKTYLERIIFYPLDWTIDMCREFDYQNTADIVDFGLKNRKHALDYKEYFRYYHAKGIKSEIHYPLKYKNALIGFVKLHYDFELSSSDVKQEITVLNNKLNMFGIELQDVLRYRIFPNYTKEISNARYLSDKSRSDLISLYSSIFDQYPYPAKEGVFLSIAEIKETLSIKQQENDDNIFVFINKGILIDFFKESNRYNSPFLGRVDWSINMYSSERLVSIECKLTSTIALSNLVKREFMQADIYFEHDFLDEFSTNYRITRYVIPLKCFIISFGGKIYSELENNNRVLKIKMLLPKFDKEALPNNV